MKSCCHLACRKIEHLACIIGYVLGACFIYYMQSDMNVSLLMLTALPFTSVFGVMLIGLCSMHSIALAYIMYGVLAIVMCVIIPNPEHAKRYLDSARTLYITLKTKYIGLKKQHLWMQPCLVCSLMCLGHIVLDIPNQVLILLYGGIELAALTGGAAMVLAVLADHFLIGQYWFLGWSTFVALGVFKICKTC